MSANLQPMDEPPHDTDPLDIEALASALARIAASGAGDDASVLDAGAAVNGLALTVAMRHSAAGDRRQGRRFAYGHTVIAPAADSDEMPAVLCLDIGPGGALVRLVSHRETGYRPPGAAGATPARWLGGRIIARRGGLHHVVFPTLRGPLLQAEFDTLLATLERRDDRIGGKMLRLAGMIERRINTLNDHGVIDLLWSRDYMAVPDDGRSPRRNRSLSPASSAFDAILARRLQTLSWRLPGDALTLLVDRNGHVAATYGPNGAAARWRGTFVDAPAFLLAARFAKQPALAILPPADRTGTDLWLATAPLHLSGRRWGCVAILKPLRPAESAEPSPAGSDRDS